jgi:hypothetical protein
MERDAADTTAAEMRVRSRDHDSSPAPGLLLAARTRGSPSQLRVNPVLAFPQAVMLDGQLRV